MSIQINTFIRARDFDHEGEEGGEEAFVREHWRLGVKIARRVAQDFGLEPEELYSDAWICLRRCAHSYDPSRGYKPSTLLWGALRNELVKAAYRELRARGWQVSHAGKKGRRTTVRRREFAASGANGNGSGRFDGDRDDRHGQLAVLAAKRADGKGGWGGDDPAELAELAETRERLNGALAGLSERDGAIVRERLGLRGSGLVGTRTLVEIGAEHGVCREQVRNWQRRAFERCAEALLAGERKVGDEAGLRAEASPDSTEHRRW